MVIISGSYPFERSSILLPTNNKEIFMDCGAPRVEGPMAKKVYEAMMKSSLEARNSKESREDKRKQRLEEFNKQMKEKQRA